MMDKHTIHFDDYRRQELMIYQEHVHCTPSQIIITISNVYLEDVADNIFFRIEK